MKSAMVRRHLKRIRDYNAIADIYNIARRYFTMNTFDGVLAILGITMASFIVGFDDRKIIITTSIAAAIAIGVSGFYGAYFTERAERRRVIKGIEEKTSVRLRGTQFEKAHRFATLELALIDCIAPFAAAIIILIPFLAGVQMKAAYYTAFTISFVMLFLLGIFLGKVSKENIVLSGFKMAIAGIACAVIIYFVEQI